MGPKFMNCCKPEQVGTKEHGKMLKRIQVLEDGRVPAKEARNWKIELKDKKESSLGKSIRGFLNKFEMEGFMAQKKIVVESRQRKCCGFRKKVTLLERKRPCMKTISG